MFLQVVCVSSHLIFTPSVPSAWCCACLLAFAERVPFISAARVFSACSLLCLGQAEDVRLELSEDGILSVMGGDKALWSSTLTPLGKRLPAFRYALYYFPFVFPRFHIIFPRWFVLLSAGSVEIGPWPRPRLRHASASPPGWKHDWTLPRGLWRFTRGGSCSGARQGQLNSFFYRNGVTPLEMAPTFLENKLLGTNVGPFCSGKRFAPFRTIAPPLWRQST